MLQYDFTNAFFPAESPHAARAPARGRLDKGWPRLAAARDEVLADAGAWASAAEIPEDKQPLDGGFIGLPERMLDGFDRQGIASELGQIQAVSNVLSQDVDAMVVLGIGGSYMGARALFEACCHPLHNELPREKRRAPRMYFAGNGLDNDATSAVRDIVDQCQFQQNVPADRYAILVISKSGGTLEPATAFRMFREHLVSKVGPSRAADFIVPITGATGRLRDLSKAMQCLNVFEIPHGVGGRFSIFTPVGLLPAALMGLDPFALLRGARRANERICQAARLGDSPAIDYAGVSCLWELEGADIRVLSVWNDGLEAAGLWYDQLLAESLGKQERGPTPLTAVNTRDLHSRGQQHQEGKRNKLITNLTVEKPSAAPLAPSKSDLNQDELNGLAGTTLSTMLQAAIDGTNQAYQEDGRPTATFTLPAKDAESMGEFFQTMMLATVLEGRLIGINPYGQPGVEAYKRNMTAILRGK